MHTKRAFAYQTTDDGYFISIVHCQKDPLNEGFFLLPFGAVEEMPPLPGRDWVDGFERPRFNFILKKWEITFDPRITKWQKLKFKLTKPRYNAILRVICWGFGLMKINKIRGEKK